MRLAEISSPNAEKPVTVPPGRARLWNSSGSLCTAGNATATTGIFVLRTMARAAAWPGERNTFTGSATSSSIMACPRATSPLALRALTMMVRPSTWPSPTSALRKAPTVTSSTSALANPTKPTIGMRCCARAASGQEAATPPTSRMNSRRFMAGPALDGFTRW
jgi:hypothetical protein